MGRGPTISLLFDVCSPHGRVLIVSVLEQQIFEAKEMSFNDPAALVGPRNRQKEKTSIPNPRGSTPSAGRER